MNHKPGHIVWHDLTVENAAEVRDFYQAVVGWEPEEVEMSGYSDYSMTADGDPPFSTGVCHARGVNSAIPPQWLMYITVENLHQSVTQCLSLGGKVLDGPRELGNDQFCVIQDPAGAVCALYEVKKAQP